MTPKQKVLKKWPKARAYKWAGRDGWVIYPGSERVLRGKVKPWILNNAFNAGAPTAAMAWAAAARHC